MYSDDDTTPIKRSSPQIYREPIPSHHTPNNLTAPNEAIESSHDHLADVHAVVRGEQRVRTQVVLRRLAELNPAEYGDWSFQDLGEALADHGVTARKSDGVMVIRAADVSRALTDRDDGDV